MQETNYIEKIFQKDQDKITLEDVKNFFSEEQEETPVLEFKSGKVAIEKICDEISAFLNTEGGLIIVGSPRELVKEIGKNKIKICSGDLELSPFASADWLQMKFYALITPPPIGINIKEFLTPEGNVFLIDVPQSTNPPHQSSDTGKYFIRLEKEAKAAPHGLVKALFDKRKKPVLDCDLVVTKEHPYKTEFMISIRNKSNVPAEKVTFMIEVYNAKSIDSYGGFNDISNDLGRRFNFTSKTNESVLVQVISLTKNFTVTDKNENFLIMISYWSKTTDFQLKYFVYDVIYRKVVEGKDHTYDFLEPFKNFIS